MDLNHYYQTARYKNPQFKSRSEYLKKRIKWLQKEVSLPFSGKILDAGCGDGSLLWHLKNTENKLKLYGTDISKTGCNLAKKLGIEAKAADMNKKIPFDNIKFDFIISHESIEHLSDPDRFLEECNRCLKKNCYLIITTPNLAAWYNRLLFLIGIHPLFSEMSTRNRQAGMGLLKLFTKNTQPLGHIRVLTIPAIKDLAKLYGFKIQKIKGMPLGIWATNPVVLFCSLIDYIFSLIPSLSSDLLVILKKEK